MTNRTRSVPMAFRAVHFGNEVLSHRLELGMSGEDVAKLVGYERTTVYKYERGVEPNMKMQHFLALCNLYDLDPREFFELGEV